MLHASQRYSRFSVTDIQGGPGVQRRDIRLEITAEDGMLTLCLGGGGTVLTSPPAGDILSMPQGRA